MVYSFDIFDTLLLRPYADPQELWRVMEREQGVPGFAMARRKADKEAYRRATERGGEATLAEAYDLMPASMRPLMEAEMQLELRVLRPNPERVEDWQSLGRQGMRRVIVSDMYLPRTLIEEALHRNGIVGWEALYLSSDRGVRKTTGELFKLMLRECQVQPGEVHHIGDNAYSDVEVPRQLGILTEHTPKVYEQLLGLCPFLRRADGHLAGTLAAGWAAFRHSHPNPTYWHRLGFMMGGVLGYMYVTWIAQTARRMGLTRLLFVARDGYVLQQICQRLYPDLQTEYIYAPRPVSLTVVGTTTADPLARKDRERYLASQLPSTDGEKVGEAYAQYIRQFAIDERCALVDGCSSGFSAQRLVEHSLGHAVFSFYLVALDDKDCSAALYKTHMCIFPFQQFSEFLFCAPEPPILAVAQLKPVYNDRVPEQEQFKMKVSEELAIGAVACAETLAAEGLTISTRQWLDYCDAFMGHLTTDDQRHLAYARNATDIGQHLFKPVTYQPWRKVDLRLVRHKCFPIGFYFKCFSHLFIIRLSRRLIHCSHNHLFY